MRRRFSRSFRKAVAFGLTVIAAGLAHESVSAETKEVPSSYGERCDAGDCFPEAVNVEGKVIPLRGISTFRYFGFQMYTAALYMPSEIAKNDVLGDAPKYLVLHYHRSFTAATLRDNTEEILKKNPEVNLAVLKPELSKLYDSYRDVTEGDSYALSYVPGEGMKLFLNGAPQVKFDGGDFAKAYFGIWLSRYGVGEDFRKRLVGG